MDNFRKKPRPNSVDGFISSRQPYNMGGQDLHGFNQYHKPNNPAHNPAQDARKKEPLTSIDGFTPSVQSNFGVPTAQYNPPSTTIGFDRPQPLPVPQSQRPKFEQTHKPKRGFLGRKKKDKTKHHKHRKRRLALRISMVAACLLLVVGGGLFLRAFLAGRDIFKGGGLSAILNNEDVDPTHLNGEGDGRVNILLLGKGGDEQDSGPDLTDTIIVASIDPLAKEASLLSIPRDLWVKSPSGYASKINEVYANAKNGVLDDYSFKERSSDEAKDKSEQAGVDALESVLSKALGVPIHYYTMIDFAGFKKAINTVGGIDVNVSEDMAVKETLWIDGKNFYLNVPAGWKHMKGPEALAFSRSRKTSAKGDFARAERQRAVILALKEKVLSTGTFANPVKINQLISDFSGEVSSSFSVNEILRVYELSKEIPADKVVSVGLDEHVSGDMINNLSVQVPKAGTFDYSDIQNYVRNIMRDAFLKKEDAKIAVLNGTKTTGLATKKSNELKSYGYNINSIGDAPTDTYTKSVLVDLRNGANKYTQNYLEKRFNIKATTSLPDPAIIPGEADFVLILGTDQVQSNQ